MSVVVQSLSHVQLFVIPWTLFKACQAPLSIGILQARTPKWIAIPFSRGSSLPGDRTQVSCIVGRFFTVWARGKPLRSSGVCSNSCPLSQWCHSTVSSSVFPFSSCLQSFQASGSWKDTNESVFRTRWPKYWSFSLSISPSNDYSALISFRMDSLDLLAVQGTLKSLLQHHSTKASVL